MKLYGFILTSEQVEATLKKVIFGTSHLKIMSIQYAGTEKAGEQVVSLATAIMENLHLSFNYMPNVKKTITNYTIATYQSHLQCTAVRSVRPRQSSLLAARNSQHCQENLETHYRLLDAGT